MKQPNRKVKSYYAFCLVTIVAAGICFHLLHYQLYGRGKGPVRPLAVTLAEFPTELGEWHVISTGLEEEIEEVLHLEDSWAGTYRDPQGHILSLFIGYYSDESVGKLHQPTVCYPGAGWTTARSERVLLGQPNPDGNGIEMNRILFTKGMNSQMVLYWYHLPGGVVADPSIAKIHQLTRMLRGEGSRSIVKIQVAVPIEKSIEASMTHAEPFLRLVVEKLARHLGPDWAVPLVSEKQVVLRGAKP